jgi:hypothetical protein
MTKSIERLIVTPDPKKSGARSPPRHACRFADALIFEGEKQAG